MNILNTTGLLSLFFCILASPISFAKTGEAVSETETTALLEALNNPRNHTGQLLKQVIVASIEIGFPIDQSSVQITRMGGAPDRYQVEFRFDGGEGTSEFAGIHIEEVEVNKGKAYVFGFRVDRQVKVQKWPGVNLGNL